ncbi:MAG: hypothetical protein ACK4NU_02770 [Brevundimonas sp.]
MRSVEFDAGQFPSGVDATNIGLPGHAKLNAVEALRLEVSFVAYVEAKGRGDLVAPDPHWDGPRGAALIRAYDQTHKDGRLQDLRGQLKRLMANRCPSCGGARPGELDHHLPKSAYQEFALFPANLVACCGSCNRTKTIDVGHVPEEAFLHPYFDNVPAIPFIAVTLEVGEHHVRATLAFDDAAEIVDDELKARMRHHFQRIDVNAQLESEVSELIGEASEEFRETVPPSSAETVRDALIKAANRKARYFGGGCWQAAVFRAMAGSQAYCEGGYRATRRTLVEPEA